MNDSDVAGLGAGEEGELAVGQDVAKNSLSSPEPQPENPESGALRPASSGFGHLIALCLVVLAVVLGGWLRVRHSEKRQFWGDEIHTYYVANEPHNLKELWSATMEGKQMSDPPLYYLLSYLNVHSSSSHSHLRIRLWSIFFGILAIPFCYRVFRRLGGEPVGVLGAFMMAGSSFAIEYSQEYRPYSMLLCTSLIFSDALLLIVERFTARRFVYLFLSSLVLIYTHFFGGFALAGGYCVWLGVLLVRQRNNPWFRKALLAAVLLPVLLTICYVPMIDYARRLAKYQSVTLSDEANSNAVGNKSLYENFKSRSSYVGDLTTSFATWRQGEMDYWASCLIFGLVAIGVVKLGILEPRKLTILAAYTLISLGLSIAFYDLMKFPYDPRRNIFHLPVFLYLLAQGVFALPVIARRIAPAPIRLLAYVAVPVFLLLVTSIMASNYVRYDSNGWRSEKNQSDWRGMAKFVNRHIRPQDVLNIPVVPETWQRLHFMFYFEQYQPDRLRTEYEKLSDINALLASGKCVWFIVSQPWALPEDTFRFLTEAGQWFNFYEGAVVFLSPSFPRTSKREDRVSFLIADKEKAAFSLARAPAPVDVILTGPLQAQVRMDGRLPYVLLGWDKGVYDAQIRYGNEPPDATTVCLYRRMVPGNWHEAKDFSSVEPGSAMIRYPLRNGQPYLELQHNGVVRYLFYCEDQGDYDFYLEAKNDKPGPVGVRVFVSRFDELPRFNFGKANNKFSQIKSRVHLEEGLNQLTLYYDSFNRTSSEQRVYEDNFNTFEATRWKFEKVKSR